MSDVEESVPVARKTRLSSAKLDENSFQLEGSGDEIVRLSLEHDCPVQKEQFSCLRGLDFGAFVKRVCFHESRSKRASASMCCVEVLVLALELARFLFTVKAGFV